MKYETRETPGCDKPDFHYYDLAYGIWTLPDGTEILFNRGYKAIWKRTPDGHVERTKNGHLTEIGFIGKKGTEEWFWDDSTAPHLSSFLWALHEKNLLKFLTGRSVREKIIR